MCSNPVRAVKFLCHHYMHHSKRKRRVGARKWLYMPVSRTRGQRANGVNDDYTGALTLSLPQKRHDMRCGTGRVTAPNQDQFTMHQHLRGGSQATPYREHDGLLSCSAAYSPFELACPQAIPEAGIGDRVINQPQSACITVREDALRPISCDNITPSFCNLSNSLIPRNTPGCATSFRANTSHRVEHSFRMIDTVQVAIDLGTEPSPSSWMVATTTHTYNPPF